MGCLVVGVSRLKERSFDFFIGNLIDNKIFKVPHKIRANGTL